MLWTCKIPTRVRCLGQAIRLEICLKLTTLRILHKLFLLPPFRLIYGNSCLGHTFLSHLQLLASQDYLGSIQFLKFDCTSYHFGKQIKLPFNNSGFFFSSSTSFNLVHSDIWDLAPIPTKRGS